MATAESVLPFAGAIGGVAEAIAVQPLDMIKTRQQLHSGKDGLIATVRKVASEGGMIRLYAGLSAECLGMIPKSAALFAAYELTRRRLSNTSLGDTSLTAACAGTVAGIPEAIMVTPAQVVKVRLQAREHLGRYHSFKHCVSKIIRTEGPSAFMIGLGPTLFRNSVFNTCYFGSMHYMKSLLPQAKSKFECLSQTLVTGFVGAVFGTCFCTPFDLAKSRFQSQLILPGQQRKYTHTFPTLLNVYTQEGFFALYKGFVAKAIRCGLGGAVAMAGFELTMYAAQNFDRQLHLTPA